MTIVSLIKYLWDGVDIPVTEEEIQHSINVMTWGVKNRIKSDDDIKELNDKYKIAQYDKVYNNIF